MAKILYFVRGGIASPAQKTEAAKMGAVFRNSCITALDFVEQCDGVAGDVPKRYAHLPRVGETVVSETVEPEMAVAMELNSAPSAKAAYLARTVAELREIAKANGITLPREVNTKEEIAEHLCLYLGEA